MEKEGKGMYLASWSGGKESALACHRAIKAGYNVTHLVNFISAEYQRVRFHGTEAGLIGQQAGLAGIGLIQKETTPTGYEAEFKAAVSRMAREGVRGMVFGDIYNDEHRDWVERVCREIGIEAVEPLWGEDTESLPSDLIDEGFEAVIVCGREGAVDREWVGRKVDRDFVSYLMKRGIDPCGENGEYHTFVAAGPIFDGRIEITKSRVVNMDGFNLLDIVEYEVSRPPLAAKEGRHA